MGVSDKIFDYLKEKKRIPKGMYNEIKKEGTLSGSFLFGGCTERSDIDVLFHPRFYKKYKELINMGYAVYDTTSYDENDECHFYSLYVKDPRGRILNLLIFSHQSTYESYIEVTEVLKKLKSVAFFKENLKGKHFRVKLFEFLKQYTKSAILNNMQSAIDDYDGTGDDVPF